MTSEVTADSVQAFALAELDRLSGPAVQVLPASRLREDLGLDSLDAVELLIAAEDRYGIVLPDRVVRELMTVEDVTAAIAGQLTSGRGGPP